MKEQITTSPLVPGYTVVIPAYNESARLPASLQKVLDFLAQRGWNAEVLVVNDGSHDETAAIVNEYAQRDSRVKLVENPGNHGKGYSVRNGMLHACGGVAIFSDADLSAPIAEAAKLCAAIEAGADVAIASRWARPEMMTERQSLMRQLLGRFFNFYLNLVLGLRFKDTQCGMKAFTREARQKIFSHQLIERWGFDPELLFLAQRFGFKVAEVPVVWAHDNRSKIHPLKDGLKMASEVLRVRWYALRGRYRDSSSVVLESGVLEPEASKRP